MSEGVLHACWTGGKLHLWGESVDRARLTTASTESPAPDAVQAHRFALGVSELRQLTAGPGAGEFTESVVHLRLPSPNGEPAASPAIAAVAREPVAPGLQIYQVPSMAIDAGRASEALDWIVERSAMSGAVGDGGPAAHVGSSLEYFAILSRFARHLIAQQRFVPMLLQQPDGSLKGQWRAWTSDEATAARLGAIVRSMPPVARACADHFRHDPLAVSDSFLSAVLDARCRETYRRETLYDAIEGRSPVEDPQVAWLGGLLGNEDSVEASLSARQDLVKRVRVWIGGLEERGASAAWRLCLRLAEPSELGVDMPGITEPAADATWTLSFHLQAVDRPLLLIDASDVWLLPSQSVTVEGRRIENAQELLLTELGRASRVYSRLEKALDDSEPTSLELTTRQAYEFLREIRPVLQEQGFGVQVPAWWETPAARLGARLRLDSGAAPPGFGPGPSVAAAAGPQLGMGAIVKYRWEIAVGDVSLTLHEFEQLASRRSPLVRINGRWVEVRPEDLQAAIRFMRENPGGQMRLAEAMRLAYGSDLRQTGIPVVGLEAEGWLAGLFTTDQATLQLQFLETPSTFQGTLRPYQVRGMSWLSFLENVGLGCCLADDMGLGKTIQLLALLAYEREQAARYNESTGGLGESAMKVAPTLLVVPMSVVGNWIHECRRFCPHLRVVVHHGAERSQGEKLVDSANASDLVVTTYALANKDRDLLGRVEWGRIVLDEAQYIKNPGAKQTQAVMSLKAQRRVALTGTPVENRLSELWSIMEFLNPGYLGAAGAFRQRFGVPIERYRDRAKADQLRGLIRPFLLRRLKTDPTVVPDLPEKIESREYCPLTSEQASLYESCVRRMLGEVEQSEGIHRRGLVLSALIKLKQICNHPSQLLHDHEEKEGALPPRELDPARSGKCVRMLEMLEEVLAEGDQALIFTQFRQMGGMLAEIIRRRFERDVLSLHGGTPQSQRQHMIEVFQKADGTHPVLILSLRAGGVGLNLTAATHVFHFDRWWNPAVENQATDRAYRIGQTRTVQVHKFVVRGTLEERIDEMIEQKTDLAVNIVGAGERWLTDLSTDELRSILTLRNDAVGDDA